MENDTQEQTNNRPWLYKKGQSGNPGGRPKGSISMKKWLADKLASMTEEEREEFINGQNKIDLFKMAEGMPDSKTEATNEVKVVLIDKELASLYGIRTAPETEGSSQEPNEVQGS